jgi:hypothetical protein
MYERHKGRFSLLKLPSRESEEVGRRGLYEHVKNKEVWYSLSKQSLGSRIKVNKRRSADAEKVMRNGVKNLKGANTSSYALFRDQR